MLVVVILFRAYDKKKMSIHVQYKHNHCKPNYGT